nr:flagellar biosynthesis anti-sigma factor FlgM [Alteribacter salitolerans]
MYRQQQGGSNNGKSPVNNRKDEVQISSEAKKMQEGTAAAKVRAEKVQEIKERVENGTYEVNVKETARRMYDFWTD